MWADQPAAPTAKAIIQDMNLAGESAESKRTRIAEDVKAHGADAAIITLPDSICWLLNIRGGDVPHTPFALSFAILNADGSTDLFMDERKSSPELVKHLGNAVRLRAPDEFAPALDALKGKTVVADPGTASSAIFDRLTKAGAKVKRGCRSVPAPQGVQEPGRDRRHPQGAYPRWRGADATSCLVGARSAEGPSDRDRRRARRWKAYRARTGSAARPVLRLHFAAPARTARWCIIA